MVSHVLGVVVFIVVVLAFIGGVLRYLDAKQEQDRLMGRHARIREDDES